MKGDSQAACETLAINNGHSYYQYYAENKVCFTVESCDDPIEGTGWDWRIYGAECGNKTN